MTTTSLIQPKNKEQELAIEVGKEFLKNGNPAEWLIIGGKAGTGKTTIVQGILEDCYKQGKILVCALSHKAKLVIADKLNAAFGPGYIVAKSVAGALGMNMDAETGKFTLNYSEAMRPAIKSANIIIVDEGSMINEESHELIMSEKKKAAKVIYLGDIRQLPPIRETGGMFADLPSPVFYSETRCVLTERIRQGEESPILPFSDFFGDNSRLKYPALNPVPQEGRKNTVTGKGALVFADNMDDVIECVLPLYMHAIEHGQMNVVKTVTYRNEMRRRINSNVRNYAFGYEAARQQFVISDLLMFQDNYNIDGFDEPLSNSLEVQINSVEQMHDGSYKVWRLGFIYESQPVHMRVLDSSEVTRHAADVNRQFEKAKKLPPGEERREELNKAWSLKQRYAPVDYAYAITSHKSQGSTYNTVVVDEMDIMSVKLTSNKSKSQSMYTAITRAATTCIVVDGSPADSSLRHAIDLSLKMI